MENNFNFILDENSADKVVRQLQPRIKRILRQEAEELLAEIKEQFEKEERNKSKWLNSADAAKHIGISLSTLANKCSNGEIPYYKRNLNGEGLVKVDPNKPKTKKVARWFLRKDLDLFLGKNKF